ncbi:acid phosphatase [Heliocybe sulcata]|uniref:Phytase A n=1 Tax=Heliocybe sulcata TaxID=5364 RepID=A0A5C3MQB6_9AGAM|nr:acid phosphatase [Heliocybe sulcata]
MSLLAFLLTVQLVLSSKAASFQLGRQASVVTDGLDLPANSKLWAQYSPWYPAQEYAALPDGCALKQVNIIQRHGARFPTSGASKRIQSAVAKLQGVDNYTDPALDFLKTFQYDLGTDDLVALGAAQSNEAGATSFERYSALVNESSLPFVRASGSTRVEDSARNWTAGFGEASGNVYVPKLSLIIDESLNDTLDDSMCTNAGNSDAQTDQWLSVFAPNITSRLNAAAPGANLTDTDTYNLMSLCPFETVAKEQVSEFCGLFSDEEWSGFQYMGDLDKYYGTGYGQELGPVQGVGYINELLARLTGEPVQDQTQTNRTLDSDPATFPLNRGIYADFSHDNEMIPIYSAMGLFKQAAPLDPTDPDPSRTWLATHLVPFSARMAVEKVGCEGKEYVRVLVNDAVQPLEFCGGDENGLCELGAFVESQAYARNNGDGDWEKCFD